jgi:DNA-binding LacI/PurR family transcriptional regulator
MARPRIDDVAKKAGVSKTAVSFAFNQPEHLNEGTRERILSVAAELGYHPSPIARGLAARRTGQIGLVVPQSTHDIFANPFLPELMRGIGDACDAEGIAVVILPPTRGSIARSVASALVDGLLLLGLVPDHPELDQVKRSGLPVVALDVESWGGTSVIAADDVDGMRQAAAHLHELGHRDVAAVLIAPHPDLPADEREGLSGRRLTGIRAGLGLAADADTDGDLHLRLVSASVSEEGGRAAFAELAADGLPTAILTMSDITAIGVMGAAQDAGLRLPEQLSIVGFDGIPAAAWVSPRLTTVAQPIREKGRLAASRLLAIIRSEDGVEPGTELLPTTLVVRGSTAPPAGPALHAASPGGGGVATS